MLHDTFSRSKEYYFFLGIIVRKVNSALDCNTSWYIQTFFHILDSPSRRWRADRTDRYVTQNHSLSTEATCWIILVGTVTRYNLNFCEDKLFQLFADEGPSWNGFCILKLAATIAMSFGSQWHDASLGKRLKILLRRIIYQDMSSS